MPRPLKMASILKHRSSRALPKELSHTWLMRVDCRTHPVRAVIEHMTAVLQDLGGGEVVSRIERDLALRYAFLSTQIELDEAAVSQGKPISIDTYHARVDRAVRIAQLLGTKRRTRDVEFGEALAETAPQLPVMPRRDREDVTDA
jgi:hypothetical protein